MLHRRCINCSNNYVNVINFLKEIKKVTEMIGENVQPVFSNLSIPEVYGLETSNRCSPSDFIKLQKKNDSLENCPRSLS